MRNVLIFLQAIEAFGYIGGYIGMWLGISLYSIYAMLEESVLIRVKNILAVRKSKQISRIVPSPVLSED